ncbi:GerMN domain-containing protein [Schaalia vaccimaxillae]|uniref:GerMN domain-containing protein n=1 Tax=Schaalia vaccimaxillae TaxID=183916 RepID=UPI0003B5E161|nr:LpqB family beta-propeller domain-containing protein [Schaalia vaccimaxillae]
MNIRRTMIAALASSCLALAGCSSLPSASSPQPFDASVPDSDPIQLSADGPTAGANPRTLIQDFLLACAAGPNDDFATARLFLTSSSSKRWKPQANALVYDTDIAPQVVSTGEGPGGEASVDVHVPAVASVDEGGILSLASGSQIDQTFTLVQENGEWRIDSPDDSFIISQSSFTASYELTNLWFPSMTGDALVADPRWYPARRLSGYLLAGLVAGPRSSLNSAVTNAVPGGTTIPSQGVEISDRTAKVSLNAAVPESEEARRLLAWSVLTTLVQATSVSNVTLTVSGQDIPTDDLPEGPDYRLDTRIVLDAGGASLFSGSVSTALPVDTPVPERAQSPAISPVGANLVAWRIDDEVVITGINEDEDASYRLTASPDGGAPSIDRFGWTWMPTPQAVSASGMVAATPAGASVEVDLDLDATGQASMVRISPDGARALLVYQNNGSSAVWLATVARDATGKPVAVTAGEQLMGGELGVVDVTWAGESGVVVAYSQGDDQDGQTVAVSMDLGGFPAVVMLPDGVEELTAGASPTSLCVVFAESSVSCQSGALWQPLDESIRSARYAG